MPLNRSIPALLVFLVLFAAAGCKPSARDVTLGMEPQTIPQSDAARLFVGLYDEDDKAVLRAMRDLTTAIRARAWPRLAVRPCGQLATGSSVDFLCCEVEGASIRFSRSVGERWQRVFESIRRSDGDAVLLETARALDGVIESLYADATAGAGWNEPHDAKPALALA